MQKELHFKLISKALSIEKENYTRIYLKSSEEIQFGMVCYD
jgi:hypothetical protein